MSAATFDIAKFISRLEFASSGCWLWTLSCVTGYGVVCFGGGTHLAHRVAYEYWVGPVPFGLTIDHLCHNADLSCAGGDACLHRRCVNPDHLEATTDRINILRSRGPAALAAKRTHCPQGHPYDEGNTYFNQRRNGHPGRRCRICTLSNAKLKRTAMKESVFDA